MDAKNCPLPLMVSWISHLKFEAHSRFSAAGEAQGDGLQVGDGIDSSVP